MTRTHFPHVFIYMIMFMLPACMPKYQHGTMESNYHNAKYAARNAAVGLHYLSIGKTNIALENLQLAMRQNPKDPLIIDSMAYYYEKTGQIKIANRYYVYALTANSDSVLANQNYGAFLCRNGYYEASIHYLDVAANLPNNPHAKTNRANLQYCQQELQRALGDQATWAYHMAQPDN